MMNPDDRFAITDTLLIQAQALDTQDFSAYLATFLPHANYRLTAWVPELNQNNTWLDLNKPDLERLLQSANQHEWNTGERLHILGQSRCWLQDGHPCTETGVAVYRLNNPGHSTLYAVGRYLDRWQSTEAGWQLAERECRLSTRQLSPPSAIPL